MKKYYVNEVHIETPIDGCKSDWNHRYVGLFDNNQFIGRGCFCGWYGIEYYVNTRLLAFFLNETNGGASYNPNRRLSEVHLCGKHFNEIPIGTTIWEKFFFAENDEEAIQKFGNLEF